MDWKKQARSLIKTELAKRDIGYTELSSLLMNWIFEKPSNLSNKINRGTFSMVFALQIFEAIGVENISLKDKI